MAGLIYDFIDQMEKITALYEELLKLSQAKTQVVIDGDAKALQDITQQEEHIVSQLNSADRNRLSLLDDIAIVLNQKKEELSLVKLAELLKEQEGVSESILRIRGLLAEIIEEIKDLNEKNARLINQSLEYIDFSMNVIQNAQRAAEPPSYGGNEVNMGRSFFDTKQ